MGVAATVVLSIAMIALVIMVMPCGATQYNVGDSTGWDTATDFNSWVQGKSFAVGDTLNFHYSSLHSVLEVSKSDYDSCQTGNALQSFSGGSTQIPLSNPGNMYFTCGTPGHCAGGMKMAIDVQAAAANGGSPATSPASSSAPHANLSTGRTAYNVAVSGVIIVAGLSLLI